MEMYLLKSAACLFLFFGFYKLFLEKESVHLFKRFYLLGAIIASFCFPFIVFTSYVEVPLQEASHQITFSNAEMISEESFLLVELLPTLFWVIYGLGVLFFGTRFSKNILTIFWKIKRNPLQKGKNFITVLLNLPTIPHTFFYYIFLNKESFEKKSIPQEVIWHEETHAKQLHSFDILFIEFLQVVFWFNPLLYFFNKSMKLNHEFLADQSVLKRGVNTTAYQKILLAFSSNAQVPALAHAINYSFIKKRFTVMKTQTSQRSIWLRTLLILPLLAITLYSFSTKKTIEIPLENSITMVKGTPVDIKIIGKKVFVNGVESSTQNFAKDLDAITKNWSKKDFANVQLDIVLQKPDKDFLKKLEQEYTKTTLYKKDPNKNGLIPPPPPKPDGNNVFIEEEIEEIKSPGPTKNVFIEKEIEELETPEPSVVEEIEFYNEFLGPDTPPPAPDATLPPPPPPPNPVQHMKELAQKGAKFYYGTKEITVKEAIDFIEKSNDINIDVRKRNNDGIIVRLSKAPIIREH